MPSQSDIAREIAKLEKLLSAKTAVPEAWDDFVRGCVIRSGNSLTRFNPYPYQVALARVLDRYPNITLVKTRQIGLSQTVASRLLHRAALNPAYTAIFFLPTSDDVSGVSSRIGEMMERNKWGVASATDNVKHIKVRNGGNLYFRGAGGKSGARGTDSVTAVALDEFCFYGTNAERILGAALASTAMTGDDANIIMLSTPDVSSGIFYEKLDAGLERGVEETCDMVRHHKIYSDDIPGFYWEGKGNSAVVIIHHSAHPIYAKMGRHDFLAYRHEIEGSPYPMILREYDLCFSVTGSTLLPHSIVKEACVLPPLQRRPSLDGRYDYYAGIDPASGGEDYCVVIILRRNIRTKLVEQVATYRQNRRDSHAYIRDIKTLLKVWKPRATCIEANGLGKTFYDHLTHDLPGLEIKPFIASSRTKLQLYAQLSHELEAKLLHLWDNYPIKAELCDLRDFGGGQIRASGKGHDDLASALALAINAYYDVTVIN